MSGARKYEILGEVRITKVTENHAACNCPECGQGFLQGDRAFLGQNRTTKQIFVVCEACETEPA